MHIFMIIQFLALCSVALSVVGESPRLLVDFQTDPPRIAPPTLARELTPGGRRYNYAASVGSLTYFNGEDDVHGVELWVTDGTRSGTRLLSDLAPGLRSAYPAGLRSLDGRLFFAATPTDEGRSMWTVDDLATGPRRIIPAPIRYGNSRPVTMGTLGGDVFFAVDHPLGTLWRLRAGADEAQPLLSSRSLEPFDYPAITCSVASGLLFLSQSETGLVNSLWLVEETTAVVRLREFLNGDRVAERDPRITCVDDKFYFGADAGDGYGIWVSDGTVEGTRPLALEGASDEVRPRIIGRDAQTVYYELRRYPSGPRAGIYALDVLTEASSPVLSGDRHNLAYPLVSGDALALIAYRETPGNVPRVAAASGSDFMPLKIKGTDFSYDGVSLADRSAFMGPDNAAYTTDGTNAGTKRVTDSLPVYVDDTLSRVPFSGNLFAVGDSVVVRAPTRPRLHAELLIARPQAGGAELLVNTVQPSAGSFPYVLGASNDIAFVCANPPGEDFPRAFAVNGAGQFQELEKPRTNRFRNGVCRGLDLFTWQDALYSWGSDNWIDIVRIDNGTLRSVDIWAPPSFSRRSPYPPHPIDGGHLLIATDENDIPTLYRIDLENGHGEALETFTGSSRFRVPLERMAPTSGGVAFASHDRAGAEPWHTDGTPDGTKLLADLNPDGGSFPRDFTKVGPFVAFIAQPTSAGDDTLYITDGTSAGTRLLTDFGLQDARRWATLHSASDGALIARVYPFRKAAKFWRVALDGTAAPVNPWPGPNGECHKPENLGQSNVYAAVTTYATGAELWHFDCAAGRVVSRIDLAPGSVGSYPTTFMPVGDLVFMSASTPETGAELYAYDTVAGTISLVGDIRPGPEPSSPGHTRSATSMAVMGDDLLFAADATGADRELWSASATGVRLARRRASNELGFELSLTRLPRAGVIVRYELSDALGSSVAEALLDSNEPSKFVPIPSSSGSASLQVTAVANAFALETEVSIPVGDILFADNFGQ